MWKHRDYLAEEQGLELAEEWVRRAQWLISVKGQDVLDEKGLRGEAAVMGRERW